MKTKANSGNGGVRWPDAYQRVTERIIQHLESGTVPWRRPWDAATGPPANLVSGRPYRGINVLLLGIERRPSPWWLTFRQAAERGGRVLKGERGTRVIKYGVIIGTPVDDAEGEPGTRPGGRRLFLREFTVFNACQVEGIDFPAAGARPELPEAERLQRAEAVARDMPGPPRIVEGEGTRALYSPPRDLVEMPAFARFESAAAYYGTLFHELVHSTGHAGRLARGSLLSIANFADHEYSKEELVAEMGAAMLASEVGVVADDHRASAAYIQSWLRVLRARGSRRWIVDAATQATKAADFILNRMPDSPGAAADDGPSERLSPPDPAERE